MAKVFMLLVLCVVLSSGNGIPSDCKACISSFIGLETQDDLQTLLKALFEKSVSNLYMSYRFADQKKERPGLAKYLKKISDNTWEEGLELIKKTLQRGGKIHETTIDIGKFTGKNYKKLFNRVFEDEKNLATQYNSLSLKAEKDSTHDADFVRFFSKKMHESAERIHEVVTHIVELENINSGIVLDIFDGNL